MVTIVAMKFAQIRLSFIWIKNLLKFLQQQSVNQKPIVEQVCDSLIIITMEQA